MIQRLLAILIFMLIAGCAAPPAPSPKSAAPEKTYSPIVKKTGAQKSVSRTTRISQTNDASDFALYDDSPIEILPDEILIVGRVKLSPELETDELKNVFAAGPEMPGKAIMVRDEYETDLPPVDDLETARTFLVTLGDDFLLTLPHGQFALLGGYVYVDGERETVSFLRLPGRWQLEIYPDDRAIYIGTIHYVRSEFDTILDYIVEDHYPQAYEKYQHRLEEGIILRKALVRWKKGMQVN